MKSFISFLKDSIIGIIPLLVISGGLFALYLLISAMSYVVFFGICLIFILIAWSALVAQIMSATKYYNTFRNKLDQLF